MSQETLGRLLERINSDEAFRDRLQKDPLNTLRDAGISAVEYVALAVNDEDALRRLLGEGEVSGYSYIYFNQWYARGIIGPTVTSVAPTTTVFQTGTVGSY